MSALDADTDSDADADWFQPNVRGFFRHPAWRERTRWAAAV
jgi:hypothetical protein